MMTARGWFRTLAVVCLAIAMLLLHGMFFGRAFGITLVSDRSSLSNRILLAFPAVIACVAGLMFAHWASKEEADE